MDPMGLRWKWGHTKTVLCQCTMRPVDGGGYSDTRPQAPPPPPSAPPLLFVFVC